MLTVLMATHNGHDTIERTLAAFTELISPAGGWKLIVVNNASAPGYEELILKWRDRLPLDYLVEPRMGRSVALNTGMGRVEGDFLVITDDDVVPNRDWLVEWRRVADQYPDCTIFGGAIEAEFEASPPPWLLSNWTAMLYAVTDPTRPEGLMDASDVLGPNLGFRWSAIADSVRFDASVGFVGRSGLLGDETEFCNRLAALGHRACFAPTARLRHLIDKEQISWRWMLQRCIRHGRTMLLFDAREHGLREPRIGGVPRYLIRRFVQMSFGAPLVALTFNPFRIFSHLRQMAYDLGAIQEARAVARSQSAAAPAD